MYGADETAPVISACGGAGMVAFSAATGVTAPPSATAGSEDT